MDNPLLVKSLLLVFFSGASAKEKSALFFSKQVVLRSGKSKFVLHLWVSSGSSVKRLHLIIEKGNTERKRKNVVLNAGVNSRLKLPIRTISRRKLMSYLLIFRNIIRFSPGCYYTMYIGTLHTGRYIYYHFGQHFRDL